MFILKFDLCPKLGRSQSGINLITMVIKNPRLTATFGRDELSTSVSVVVHFPGVEETGVAKYVDYTFDQLPKFKQKSCISLPGRTLCTFLS